MDRTGGVRIGDEGVFGLLPDPSALLLYDGLCPLCSRTVRLVLKADRRGDIRFAPLSSPVGQAIIAVVPEYATIDSILFVTRVGDSIFVSSKSEALLRVLTYLPWPYRVFNMFRILPRGARDWFYDVIARNRYRAWGRLDECQLPPIEVRNRFLM